MIKHKELRANFYEVQINELSLYFSYETIIGFQNGCNPPVISENVWSTTTGKHLNQIALKEKRIPHEEFKVKLDKLLKETFHA